jgi:hypothetical protein
VKEKARVTLNFLLLDKDKISENLRGKFSIYEKSIEELLVPYRKSKAPNAEMDARMKSQISHGHPQTIDLSCDLAPSDGGFRLSIKYHLSFIGVNINCRDVREKNNINF